MTATFLCASLGIVPTVRHADYIGSWLAVLRDDDRAIVRAASQASKAADWLLAFLPEGRQAVIAGKPLRTLLILISYRTFRRRRCVAEGFRRTS
jgi:antirestriction protein ArdC